MSRVRVPSPAPDSTSAVPSVRLSLRSRAGAPMEEHVSPGQIVILNGAPRAGKSSIVRVIQDTFEGVWMNLGVDVFARGVLPKRYQPGIGLRPGPGPGFGGDKPELEPLVPVLYAAMYESIAAHSRLGLNVISDVGHHGAIHSHVLGRLRATAHGAARAVRRPALPD